MKKIMFMLIIFTLLFFIKIHVVNAFYDSNNLMKTVTKDKIIYIKDDDNGSFNYSWTFDKEEYEKNEFEFDLSINFTSNNQYEIEKRLKHDEKNKLISFNYHGNLPTSAMIKVLVSDKFKDGDKLKLYYYDDETKDVELIDSNVKVINGCVSFEIKHCSDYFLTLAVVNDVNKSNNNGIIIISMIIIILGLIGYTLFNKK